MQALDKEMLYVLQMFNILKLFSTKNDLILELNAQCTELTLEEPRELKCGEIVRKRNNFCAFQCIMHFLVCRFFYFKSKGFTV